MLIHDFSHRNLCRSVTNCLMAEPNLKFGSPRRLRSGMGIFKMENINAKELTREQIQKVMACETAEELMAVAKAEGFELTEKEAEAYMDEFINADLDDEALAKVAGGGWSSPSCGDDTAWTYAD